MKITCKRTFDNLRIYFSGILHLQLGMRNHDGVESWIEGEETKVYKIEFYRKKGKPILVAYDSFKKWKSVLNLIDKNI